MDEIMKMIRHDFIAVRAITFKPIVIICSVICLLSMLLFPLAVVMIPMLVAVMFNPIQAIADKSSFNRLYGVLPVKKSSAVWARFAEVVLCSFAGEMLAVFVGYVSATAIIYVVFPYPVTVLSEQMLEMQNSGQLLLLLITACQMIFVFYSIVVCFFTMASLIAGQENEMTFAGIFLLIVLLLAIVFSYLISHEMINIDIDAIMDFLIPENILQWIGGIFLCHILTFGICALFGLITVKVLDKREL